MISFSNAVKSDRLQAFTRALDAGSGGGKIRLYGGTQPAAGAAHSQALLCELTLPKPSAISVTGGILTIASPFSGMALMDGVVTWCRLSDSAGSFVADCDAGGSASTAVFRIQNEAGEVFAGGQVIVNQAQLKEV
ncbi:hypothetical protein H0S57_08155 [Acinetobacter johnsonii]|uniref:hypothetical protein n=1 Tax=Acinetobacter johnsonii TaxID=40214 RepID=UPI00189F6319|nr:hypothetical protein [Acinetobacter johnsonii]QPF36521.1 hypothetical protein H0S57_08155 [Acinetobacter johnsonii]